MKGVGQILDQVAEIHPAVGSEEKDRFTPVELVFDPHQLHLHAALDNPAQTEVKSLMFLLPVAFKGCQIIQGGFAFYGDQFLAFPDFPLDRSAHDLTDAETALRLNHHTVTDGNVHVGGIEIIQLAGCRKLNRNNSWQTILLSKLEILSGAVSGKYF